MSFATWFPSPLLGEAANQHRCELPAADFRVAFKAEFQRQVMRCFFTEIQAKTGDSTIKDIVAKLEVSGDDESALRVWYSRARGGRRPRRETLAMVQRSIPGLKLDIHHPMLTWLGTPDLNPRSVRRLKTQMPTHWHQALDMLISTPTDHVQASPKLVSHLGLDRFGYLDSMMLFAADRCLSSATVERRRMLEQILWLLPVLYPDDPLWAGCDTSMHRDRHRWLLTLIDHSLGLLGDENPARVWGSGDRLVVMFTQHWNLRQHLKTYPHACRTRRERRRYWARIWRFRNGDLTAINTVHRVYPG